MLAHLLTSLLLSSSLTSQPAVEKAPPAITEEPRLQVELIAWEGPRDCKARKFHLPRVTATGRYAVKIEGVNCERWGFATVRVTPAPLEYARVER